MGIGFDLVWNLVGLSREMAVVMHGWRGMGMHRRRLGSLNLSLGCGLVGGKMRIFQDVE